MDLRELLREGYKTQYRDTNNSSKGIRYVVGSRITNPEFNVGQNISNYDKNLKEIYNNRSLDIVVIWDTEGNIVYPIPDRKVGLYEL